MHGARFKQLSFSAWRVFPLLVLLQGFMMTSVPAGELAAGGTPATPANAWAANQLVTPDAAEMNRSLLALQAQYTQAGGAQQQAQLLAQIRDLAATRQQLLATLVENDPAEVLRVALPQSVRSTLPADIQAYIEQEREAEGTLEILVEDRPNGSTTHYELKTQTGEQLALRFAALPDLPSGSHVRVHGVRIGATLAVGPSAASLQTLEPSTGPIAPIESIPGRLLVKPHAHLTPQDVQALFAQHGAGEVDAIPQIGVHIVSVPAADVGRVLDALQHNPNVEFVEPDYVVPPDLTPNDPKYASEWHLPKTQAPQSWNTTVGSSSVIIAILDTGVDGTHPDLAANLVPGWNFYDNNADTSDVYGHGTAVAGTAGAVSNNGTGVAGMAWGCRLMPVRISDLQGYGYSSTISKGLTWSADQGARVANISYRMSTSSSVTSAAQYFMNKGGVVTISAGNESTFIADADNPYVLTVTATDSTDTLASFSNTGNNIDLAAPGVSIVTTTRGGGYGSWSGTSFSAPLVAGVAALVLSANPTLSGAAAQDILKQSTDDLGPAGWDTAYGYGRLNAYKAVLAATNSPAPDTTAPTASIDSPSSGSTVSGVVAVNASASDNVGVTEIDCYADGVLIGRATSSPASCPWDTTTHPNGTATLLARAYDQAGNFADATVAVTVSNGVAVDTTAPSIVIVSPANGTTVSRTVSVTVNASDDTAVTKVELYVDGKLTATSTSAPFTTSWNPRKAAAGAHTLLCKAYDAAGNAGASQSVTVYK